MKFDCRYLMRYSRFGTIMPLDQAKHTCPGVGLLKRTGEILHAFLLLLIFFSKSTFMKVI